MKSLSVCALAAFFALVFFTPGASAQQYTITNLGGLTLRNNEADFIEVEVDE